MPPTDAPKNYILVGDDHNGAFAEAIATYARDPEHNVIIRAKPGESLDDALKEIKGPANIILEAHGGRDGTFTWNKNERIPYEKMLAELPRQGVESVTLGSCYGGTAERDDILRAAPAGTVVQSSVGPNNEGLSGSIARFAETAHKGGSSTQLFMESLAAFDPKEYTNAIQINNQRDHTFEDANAEHALPHMLGIGGRPPTLINLDKTVTQIVDRATPIDAATWAKAVSETHQVFEHAAHSRSSTVSAASDDALIDRVAQKMMTHQEPVGAEEKRVAFAITAAYMEQSGALQREVAVEKGGTNREPVTLAQPKVEPHHTDMHPPATPATDLSHFAPQDKTPLHPEKPEPPHPIIHKTPAGMPDLAAIKQEVFGNHALVTERHQNASETKALEDFAKTMHISGVRTDAAQLSDAEIKKIQAALHVKQDGKVGEKTLSAMIHAEEVHALPTPSAAAPAVKGQAH